MRSGAGSYRLPNNMLIASFNPGNFKGVIFLSGKSLFEEDHGANYGPELSAPANCWKESFRREDPHFFYTIPNREPVPKITRPKKIKDKGTACEIRHWLTAKRKGWNVAEEDAAIVNKQLPGLIDLAVREA